jgi:hypothetical protein
VPAERYSATAEAAAYFVCSEALANAAKYAHASSIRVQVTAADGVVIVEVADDGLATVDAVAILAPLARPGVATVRWAAWARVAYFRHRVHSRCLGSGEHDGRPWLTAMTGRSVAVDGAAI